MTKITLDLQKATAHLQCPKKTQFKSWVAAAMQQQQSTEITIRLVDESESQALNAQYRGIDKPTNVLSFPFAAPAQLKLNLLGDLVICAPLVATEAAQQHKDELAHWAHLVVHGTLHLQGFDHIDEAQAETMEQLEIAILDTLGFNNPYVSGDEE